VLEGKTIYYSVVGLYFSHAARAGTPTATPPHAGTHAFKTVSVFFCLSAFFIYSGPGKTTIFKATFATFVDDRHSPSGDQFDKSLVFEGTSFKNSFSP
jgi:hypothetical protein